MKVLVTVPNQGSMHKMTAMSLLRLQAETRGHHVKIMLPTHSPYDNNMNIIIRDVVDGDYDFWLTIDSDQSWTKNPLELIDLDKDIMVLPTPQWHYGEDDIKKGNYPIFINAMDEVPDGFKEHQTKTGLQKVDAGGSGSLLVARRVLEVPGMHFQRIWNEHGVVEQGADFTFCQKARMAGFEVWAHYDYMCHHFKEVSLLEVMNAFGKHYESKRV